MVTHLLYRCRRRCFCDSLDASSDVVKETVTYGKKRRINVEKEKKEFVDRQRKVRSVTVTMTVIVILIATVIVTMTDLPLQILRKFYIFYFISIYNSISRFLMYACIHITETSFFYYIKRTGRTSGTTVNRMNGKWTGSGQEADGMRDQVSYISALRLHLILYQIYYIK